MAEQIVLDMAAQVVAERGLGAPAAYADVCAVLGAAGVLDARDAVEPADAARRRNLLIHLYLEAQRQHASTSASAPAGGPASART